MEDADDAAERRSPSGWLRQGSTPGSEAEAQQSGVRLRRLRTALLGQAGSFRHLRPLSGADAERGVKPVNRHARRAQRSRLRRADVTNWKPQQSGRPLPDHPEFLPGIAKVIRAIEFKGLPDLGGHCLFNCLVAMQAMHSCGIASTLHVGSLVYRIGPDPHLDVVAFCGPGNAGGDYQGFKLFHAWVQAGDDDILDFSVGDWRGLDYAAEVTDGRPASRPPIWTVEPPDYWRLPRKQAVGGWRPEGSPELGEAWYGPYHGDAAEVGRSVRDIAEDALPIVAAAVERVYDQYAGCLGIVRDRSVTTLVNVNPIVESNLPAMTRGMIEMKLSELFAIAGYDMMGLPDTQAFVSERPVTKADAIDLLRNMTINAPQ
jgi:hypothetical protein